MRLIDTHTHLDFPDFDADRARLLANAAARGVERMVVLGVYQANFQRVWALAGAEPGLYAALGLHPVYLEQHRPEHLQQLREWLERLRGDPRLCAVGEFGLDYYLEHLDKARQQALFEAQLQMACDFQLPALLHVRRSHAQVIATLKRYKPARAGVVHQAGLSAGAGRCSDLAAGIAAAQDPGAPAAGQRGAGDRCARHGAGHVPRGEEQPGASARDSRCAGTSDGCRGRRAGCREYPQRV